MNVMGLELFLVASAFTVLLADLFCFGGKSDSDKNATIGWLTTLLLLAGLGMSFTCASNTGEMFSGVYQKTSVSLIFQQIFILAALFCSLCSIDLLSNKTAHRWPAFTSAAEYYVLLLFAVVGMCYLVCAQEMLFLWVSLELATIPLFVLSAYLLSDKLGAEAGIKFVLLGALSTGVLLYGLSLLYGAMGGETMLVAKSFESFSWNGMALVGVLMILAGLGFKVTAAPFHLWAPDVYQGSPTPVTAFLSVGSKAAGLAALWKICSVLFGAGGVSAEHLHLAFALLAVLTMTWGNVVAIKQSNIKRFLAYSSISQAGYIFLAFLSDTAFASTSLLFYLIVYLFTNIAAFSIAIAFENQTGSVEMDDYKGFAQRNPGLALVMMLSLFSLAGIPPLPGFFGKFWLFAVAAQQDMHWLVLVAALNSTVSLYYYLQLVRRMYISEKEDTSQVELSSAMKLSIAGSCAGMALVVIFPSLLERIFELTNSLAS